jgi:hypothetical protein
MAASGINKLPSFSSTMWKKATPNNKIVPLARVPHLPLLDEEDSSSPAALEQCPSTLFKCLLHLGMTRLSFFLTIFSVVSMIARNLAIHTSFFVREMLAEKW